MKPSTKATGGTYKGAPKGTAPSTGQTKKSVQRGATSPRTDGGGGVGNTGSELAGYLRKK